MRFFTSIYLLLLAYIVVALGFWELSLQKQSGRIYAQEVLTLRSQVDSTQSPVQFNQQLVLLQSNLKSRTIQYIGEGSAFLIVILIGAFVVYTSFRRRILLSRQQNNFMLSVTHELKSPIAAMKLNLQTLEKHKLDENNKTKLIGRCIKEANRLNDLCNNVLFTSQIDGRQYKQAKEPFNLSEMVEQVVEQYAARYPQRFEEEIDTGCHIVGDVVMLQIALNNLLENAIKYTPQDKPISVMLHKKENTATIQVIDEGAGIPEVEKKKIFNKFYRVGNEESRKTQGTGIGLYLVHKVIQQHKGRIIVKDNTPSGAIFDITLPLGK
jgi:signal transduction histidine kinase